MSAARYWRLTAIETYDAGDLELSELALYDGATRVDAGATISSVFAPASGALADLSDVDFGTTVAWPFADIRLAAFALVWDFGAPQNVDKIGAAGPARASFLQRFVLQYSSDGSNWANLISSTLGLKWVNSSSIATKIEREDAIAAATSILLNGNGTNGSQVIVDSSLRPKVVTAFGTAQISTAQSLHGGSSLQLSGAGNYISTPRHVDFEPGTGDFTIAFNWRPIDVTNTQILAAYTRDAVFDNTDIGFFIAYNPGAAIIQFVMVSGLSEVSIVGSVAPLVGQFNHVEVVRSGSNFYLFIRGTPAGTVSSALGMNAPFTANLYLGRRFNTAPLPANGWMEDFTFIKGEALHTAAFTPPTVEASLPPFDVTPYRVSLPVAPTKIVEAPPPAFDNYMPSEIRGYYDREDGGNFRVAGTVKEVAVPSNTPLSRRVRLAYQDSGRVIREAFSDAAGNYSFDHIRGDRRYMVTALDHAQIYRPVAADQLTAEPMP